MSERTPLEKAQELLAKWQDRLRLVDWDISIEIVHRSKLSLPDVRGTVTCHPEKTTAWIKIGDRAHFTDEDLNQSDCEYTIVHELLHVRLWGMGARDGSPEALAEEQAIHAIARALIALDSDKSKQGESR